MDTAIIFDCEFLVSEGAQQRFWCGPFDPDPVVAQVGAVKLSLSGDFAFVETFRSFVRPLDRSGVPYEIDPFFTRLTGIDGATIASEGQRLEDVLHNFDQFSDGAKLWSWGKDEMNLIAISCFVAGIAPPIAAPRFDNACKLLLRAGMPYDAIKVTRSTALAAYFALDMPPLKAHDALDDAISVATVLQHLLRQGTLRAEDFAA